MSGQLRILIVDDHPIVRRGLKEILVEAARITDVGEADSPQQALDLVRSRDWDVVVLDIGLPGRGGLDVLKELKQAYPKLPILMLSMHREDEYAVRAIRAGAAGYLTKDAATAKLVEAVRKVASGGRYISPALAERLAVELSVDASKPLHEWLSDREFEVLCLIASGHTVGQIAVRLSLSVKTVSGYRARVLDKMHLKNNAELMQYALKNHLVD